MSHIYFAPQCGSFCSWSSGPSGSVNNRVNFRETERRETLFNSRSRLQQPFPPFFFFFFFCTHIITPPPQPPPARTWVNYHTRSQIFFLLGSPAKFPTKLVSCDCQKLCICPADQNAAKTLIWHRKRTKSVKVRVESRRAVVQFFPQIDFFFFLRT